MIQSLMSTTSSQLQFQVLALDDETFDYLTRLNRKEITPLKLADFVDESLAELRQTRSWREFCWTLPAYMLEIALSTDSAFSFIAYVDSDCFFFSDFQHLIKELGTAKSILIHPHRFPAGKKYMEYESGIYNVGVILGRANGDFLEVVQRWKEDVTAECVLDPAAGKCGDQTYLNNWPEVFECVKIAQSHGIGAGPWNIESSEYSRSDGMVYVDGDELVFYHFSRFKPIYISKYVNLSSAALGYSVPNIIRTSVYRKYLRAYSNQSVKINKSFRKKLFKNGGFKTLASGLKQNQIVTYLDFPLNLLGRRIKNMGIPK